MRLQQFFKRNLFAVFCLCMFGLSFSTMILDSCATQSQAQTTGPHLNGAPVCTPERFYDGPEETENYVELATDACVLGPTEEASITLQFDHVFQRMNLQMGSNTGSELEWDFCVIIAPPPENRSTWIRECLQYDKHQDVSGNRAQPYLYPVGLHLPAGTKITVWRRALPYSYCTKEGDYGSNGGKACATGQKITLIGVPR